MNFQRFVALLGPSKIDELHTFYYDQKKKSDETTKREHALAFLLFLQDAFEKYEPTNEEEQEAKNALLTSYKKRLMMHDAIYYSKTLISSIKTKITSSGS